VKAPRCLSPVLAAVVATCAGASAFWAAVAPAGGAPAATVPTKGRPYRLPPADLKARVLWGSVCEGPDGTALAFGGQDQEAEDGRPHTRLRIGGRWVAIHEDLAAANPLQGLHIRARALARRQRMVLAAARATYLKGLGSPPEGASLLVMLARDEAEVLADVRRLREDLTARAASLKAPLAAAATGADQALARAEARLAGVAEVLAAGLVPAVLRAMHAAQVETEMAGDLLGAEPPPRALSPLVYEPKTGLFVLFGGDHFDYLTADTWVFDPRARRWSVRRPAPSPPPRAGHRLRAPGDGTVVLEGGYTYASNTDYCGGQYLDLADGPWTYDVAADRWTGPGPTAAPGDRTYRTGPFHPDFYLGGPPPDAAGHEKRLARLPANRWVLLKPPRVPRLNRDWGTVRLDPDRDQILVWCGGHSAHGGTDVLHYHLGTNRWELPYPVALPLGQLYANTAYPDGWTFNLRPWPTGHTYQSYAYDPLSEKMLFVGRPRYTYIYDPDVADWVARQPKPPGMVYGSCYYTLTLCSTPRGVYCWGQSPWRDRGLVHRYDPERKEWVRVAVEGSLPEPAVDYSTMVFDARRNRLLMLRTDYGKPPDGQVYALDLETGRAGPLDPVNRRAAARFAYTIDRACYLPEADLMLLCALLPAGPDGRRRHIAYDCARNRWVSLRIDYEKDSRGPLAPTAVRRSVGLVWDGRRRLVWGVDTNRLRVFVLRFEPGEADVRPLGRGP